MVVDLYEKYIIVLVPVEWPFSESTKIEHRRVVEIEKKKKNLNEGMHESNRGSLVMGKRCVADHWQWGTLIFNVSY